MKRIELSRKHGAFDPRWIELRRGKHATRLDDKRLTSVPVALKAWESEGGAVLGDERPRNLVAVAGAKA